MEVDGPPPSAMQHPQQPPTPSSSSQALEPKPQLPLQSPSQPPQAFPLLDPTRPAPTSSPHPRHPRFVELSSPAVLEPLLDFLSTDAIPARFAAATREFLSRRIRITRPENLPYAPPSAALAARVAALEARATALAARVAAARERALPSLHETVRARVEELVALPPQLPVCAAQPIKYADLAAASAEATKGLTERVAAVKKGAKATKRRAASVREVLRIISENVVVSEDVTQELADDWTGSFGDLPRGKRQASAMDWGPETPDDSPVPLFRREEDEGERVFLATSPHITPRSKLRKRVARNSGREIRKMSFSPGSLPR